MSSSSPISLDSKRCRLEVFATPGTEIAVQDGQFRLVDDGRGVGQWAGDLSPGLYKVRLRSGQAHREEHVLLNGPVVRDFRAEPLLFASAAPLERTAKTHEYQIAAARTESKRIHLRPGSGAQVFLLARNWTTSTSQPGAPADPAAGLTLRAPNGKVICDMAASVRSAPQPGLDAWAACNVEVDPGTYFLWLDLPSGPLCQTIVAVPDWQTLVFVVTRSYRGPGDEPVRAADLNGASILMARPGTFDPSGEDFRLADIARLALAQDRRRVVSGEVEFRLLSAKYENPMFGLLGAYLFLRSEQQKPAEQQKLSSFGPILANLRRLLGTNHPDVEALSEAFSPGSTTHTFAMPPMLRASWEGVVRATAQRPGLIPVGSVADRAADRVWGVGPWLVWAGKFAKSGMESLGELEMVGAAAPPDTAAIARFLEAPRATEAALIDTKQGKETTSVAKAVAALGLPQHRVQALMAEVTRDRDRLGSLTSPEVVSAFKVAGNPGTRSVRVEDRTVDIPVPFPSPADWRDHWVYFLLLDRFHNPAAPPRHTPWDAPFGGYQGGTFSGVREKLRYIKDLGAGAIWLSPVQKNRSSDPFSFHGYGIQNFLRIEPRFASAPERAEDELRALVDEAHALGLYVIFDVVLNHAGDVFEYSGFGPSAPWSDSPRSVRWRDSDGLPRRDWPAAEDVPDALADALVWPAELQQNAYFRRQGMGGEDGGDFDSLKELVTAYRGPDGRFPVRDVLIRACQYLIARFDVDGFRIDTLKYVEREFAQAFGNAVREYALSIGKKNFFSFGEVYDEEEKIARFIGRNAGEDGDLVGVDAALDFPLFYRLPDVAKGLATPAEVARVFRRRKEVERGVLSTHGDASRYFVTFLDNHDQHRRFRYAPNGGSTMYDAQVPLGVGLIMTLQGIPCVYYGTEQGLAGTGETDAAVREALWGKPSAFDTNHPIYRAIADLSRIRVAEPALRYGCQYFRPVSGDGVRFGLSETAPGILAVSRILNDREVLVVANTHVNDHWSGYVLVDAALNKVGVKPTVLYGRGPPEPVTEVTNADVQEEDDSRRRGAVRALKVTLAPMELLILATQVQP